MRRLRQSVWLRARLCPIWVRNLYANRQTLTQALLDESGQDLIENTLVIALICLVIVVGIRSLAALAGAGSTDTGGALVGYVF